MEGDVYFPDGWQDHFQHEAAGLSRSNGDPRSGTSRASGTRETWNLNKGPAVDGRSGFNHGFQVLRFMDFATIHSTWGVVFQVWFGYGLASGRPAGTAAAMPTSAMTLWSTAGRRSATWAPARLWPDSGTHPRGLTRTGVQDGWFPVNRTIFVHNYKK